MSPCRWKLCFRGKKAILALSLFIHLWRDETSADLMHFSILVVVFKCVCEWSSSSCVLSVSWFLPTTPALLFWSTSGKPLWLLVTKNELCLIYGVVLVKLCIVKIFLLWPKYWASSFCSVLGRHSSSTCHRFLQICSIYKLCIYISLVKYFNIWRFFLF